jgi:two-component system nitrate/nitrite response regulator NarL
MPINHSSISILLVDDHQLVLDGIKSMLTSAPQIKVIAAVNDGEKAYDIIQQNPQSIDIVITDISMPMLSGIELCKMIKSSFPHIKVLILSMYNNTSVVKDAIAADADGYILKNTDREEFLIALHRIIDEGTYYSKDIIPIIYAQFQKEKIGEANLNSLTQREKEVLSLIIKEFTSEEIAQKLFISKKTVDNHRANILIKTQCSSTIGLVKFAIKNGLS